MSGKSRMARVFGRIMRQTAVFDREGTRWMIQVLSPPPTVIVLVNRGRKSGRLYKTPLSILVEDPERGEVVVSPMWGRDSDWYRNVIAGGLVEIHVRGEKRQVEWRELDEAERRVAGEAFRDAHPIYSGIDLQRHDPAEAGPPERARGRPCGGGGAEPADARLTPNRILTGSLRRPLRRKSSSDSA